MVLTTIIFSIFAKMERIYLSKAEKKILRDLRAGRKSVPDGMDNFTYFDAIVSLKEKKLVKAVTEYDRDVIDLKLLTKGYSYLNVNPHLWNPINWTKIAAISATIAAIAATVALFISCLKL